MMTPFPKYFALPPLQLLFPMLVIGAGLLPKNSLADPAGAESPVLCWDHRCETHSYLGGSPPEDCVKTPVELGAGKANCSTGYCFVGTQIYSATLTRAKRHCAYDWMLPCFKDKPCIISDFTKPEEYDEFNKNLECESDAQWDRQTGGRPRPTREPTTTSPTENRRTEGESIRCVCKGNFCNDHTLNLTKYLTPSTTPSGATGVKHLSYNVALVGALLLVSIFPFRRMFLVG